MAHNRSPSRLRSDVLALRLATLTDHMLEIECGRPGCRPGRAHRLEALARLYPDATVAQTLTRLRCVACGQGPAAVVLVELRPGRRVPLVGPECRY